MPVINIGNSGYINYIVNENICYGGNNGSINLSEIFFDNLYPTFIQYSVDWYAENLQISGSQISNDTRSIVSLEDDVYYFTIRSSIFEESALGPYQVILSPSTEFKITTIKSSEYSCGSNGYIFIGVQGGVPPYEFIVGPTKTTQSSNEYLSTGLSPGFYGITIVDSQGCVATNNINTGNIILKNSESQITDLTILPPKILDSYGNVNISISGLGPYNISFINQDTDIRFDALDTTHLSSFNYDQQTYTYTFSDILTPGTYSLNISNKFNCVITQNINIPNLQPISTSIGVTPNLIQSFFVPKQIDIIYDTIFIPYKEIQNNSNLWQFIQKVIHNKKIEFKINNIIVQHSISRSFLAPYCIENNEIEVLRLDNNPNNWYFYFHVAPGILLRDNLNLIDTEMYLVDKDNNAEYKLLFGLTTDNNISHDYPSLLVGSFMLQGADHDDFFDGAKVNIIESEISPQISDGLNFFTDNIKTQLYYNTYNLGYVTTIYFLENFHRLIQNINIDNSACTISNDDYQYIINIKNMLISLNLFNNYNNFYIYNPNAIPDIGSITLSIVGSPTIINNNNEFIDNTFYIDYFTFDSESDRLYSFYKNNQKISNTNLLSNIRDGYVIIRIKDINNNKVKFINFNNTIVSYDKHFILAKNILQNYNTKIKELFLYGDILVYVPKNLDEIDTDTSGIPSSLVPPTIEQPTSLIPEVAIINQSQDKINTASLTIETLPDNAVCYLLGPKNYKKKFIGKTIFQNVVPGVYSITGDEDYLFDNQLYQNNNRLIIYKDQEYTTDIKFKSYLDKIFIKE